MGSDASLSTAHATRTQSPVAVLAILVGAGVLATAAFWGSDYHSRILGVMALAVIAATGLNIVTGATGQMALGHAGFYAVGAYATAMLSVRHGWPVLYTLPVAVAINALLGLALAWPALRLRGPYLTMVTVAFGLIVHSCAVDFPKFTNGPEGIFPVPPLALAGHRLSLQEFNLVLVAAAGGALYLQASLFRSRYGRALRAVRGHELAAGTLGVPVVALKCFAFALSGALAGLAGALFAPLNGFVNPDGFTLDLSVQMLLMVILGGVGSVWGPVAGAVVLVVLDRLLSGFGDVRLIVYGLMLVGLIYLAPDGAVGLWKRWRERRATQASGSQSDAAPAPAAAPLPRVQAQTGALELSGVSKSFGGLKAVDAVDLHVAPREIHGIVGPNGAGKTTVLNLISGVTQATSGEVHYAGLPLARSAAHHIARRGIARTFQNLALFGEMTVLENVMVGLHMHGGATLAQALAGTPAIAREEALLERQAMELLAFVGLAHEAHRAAATLPQGHQRLLEIARALAVRPSLLLLDEPAAGLNAQEIDRLMALVRDIRGSGVTVVLIEHHMQLVMAVCDAVTVLDFGRVIASGAPDTVRRDPAVIEAYLGKPAAAPLEHEEAHA